ncbi:MAG: DNA-directed RNA polymerase subunit beta [Alphaproteobacteria bacterium]|jgi:DNA-directed RNA polymerase subunit beta|nr:DNA-directed RNA polymerase subunit beta [Alphaproteobacteria bacterium]
MERLNNSVRIRRNYSKIKSVEAIPDLIQMQKESYAKFLQLNVPKSKRTNTGLHGVLNSIFPVNSNDGRFILEFIDYSFDEPKYSINESKNRDANYALPLKIKLRLITNDINKETGSVTVKDIKEQDIVLCDIPLMTEDGTFVINGTERVIVSQIYRSPGVFFDHDKGKNTNSRLLYSASVIPHVGSWLDVEFDSKDLLNVRIDKRKKIPLTCLLRSLDSIKTEKIREKLVAEGKEINPENVEGMPAEEILETFYDKISVKADKDGYIIDFVSDLYKGRKLSFDLLDATSKEVLIKADTTINAGLLRKLERSKIAKVLVPEEEIIGRYISKDITDKNGAVVINAGLEINKETLERFAEEEIKEFDILLIDNITVGSYLLNTLLADKNDTRFKSLNEIYRVVKSADAPNIEVADEFFRSLFFSNERYDLSNVGRVKINEKFGLNDPEELTVLTKKDIINIVKHLLKIRDGHFGVDDIDNLGNRIVRSVGELVENELRIVFVRMERYIQEKMASMEELMPAETINVKAVQAALRDFFGSSQLSQFMDQTNPLSEITHKRRLSALGPKGLTRERASFEVRDVHLTHYGRICPIETPEGPNIGLINSLACYAKINKYGFLETPYRVVDNGIVSNEIVYLNATKEGNHPIAQSSSTMDSSNRLTEELVTCRVAGEAALCSPMEVKYMEVSPTQLVSVAASLVPFLENDDANRALMGANMQRQAVPLLKAEAPIVGTGMEGLVARDSGVTVLSKTDGIVYQVDAKRIVVKAIDDKGLPYDLIVYDLKKFQRSNHNTCINQKPLVKVGDKVKKGDIIADGHSIDNGELALGKNVLVAFMPWNGYNFEDSILISERVVKDDVFTSVHIEEFEVVARDTKLGAEDITADIPNIGDEALKNLDESGIVYIGAEVKSGDILVGKVTPKAETVVTAEEKLLRAIFGEKAVDVKDTSLRVPSGISGTVIGVSVFSRRGVEKDSRTQSMERTYIDKLTAEKEEEHSVINSLYKIRLTENLKGKEVSSGKGVSSGDILKEATLEKMSLSDLLKITLKDKTAMASINEIIGEYDISIARLNKNYQDKITILQKGDDLPSGVLKMVKVFIAVKRKLQPGDKMAGRHGNKGVVSKILPVEDMPYLEDGTPVDICLNPLGVPSRMNVGQILEVHLGWACANIGKKVSSMLEDYYNDKTNVNDIREYFLKCYGDNEIETIKSLSDDQILSLAKSNKKGLHIATPVFDGVKEKDIDNLLKINNVDASAQVTLIDGRTGEPFERKVTVGFIYMLKLHHLVDDKIHARSIGPYSLITQQPLGGKAQFGGQRFGEMEVWALEAYGAAHILQEMLTVKSDDQTGRNHVYESIIKGEETFSTGIPESFNVLVKELRSLCLNLEMKKLEE